MNRVPQQGGRFVATVALCGLLAVAGGCDKLGLFVNDVPLRLADDVRAPDRCAVVFFVDCMNAHTVRRMLARGRLPNIRKYFADGGVRVQNATTVLPTITYAATTSMLTGQLPGRHGILGNTWFDRYERRHRTYISVWTYDRVNAEYNAPNVFEMLGGAGQDTAVITCPNRRGATSEFRNVLSAAFSYSQGNYELMDWISALRVGELGDRVNAGSKRWPQLVLVYLPASDEVMHRAEPDSRRYRRSLENVDRCIGKVCEALERNGLLERTYLTLISDHGGVEAEHSIHLVPWLERHCGLLATTEKTWPHQSDAERRGIFESRHAVVVVDGKRCATIHLRGPGGWDSRPSWAQMLWYHRDHGGKKAARRSIPRMLAHNRRIDLVAYKAEADRYRLLCRDGEIELRRHRNAPDATAPATPSSMARCRYSVRRISGRDPLRLGEAAVGLMDGKPHADGLWREATAGGARPDLIGLIPQLFDHRRSGEIVVFAGRFAGVGYDFGGETDGDHGGVSAREVRVPMYFAGPGLPAGASIAAGRVVDLTPTLLGLLGHQPLLKKYPMDGRDLAGELRAATAH